MKKPEIKIKISTRLLIYFLLVAILPIFILAFSSSFILNSHLNNSMILQLGSANDLLSKVYNSSIEQVKSSVNNIIVQISLFSALAGITLSYVLATLITTPISKITNVAQSIENGDFTKRVDVKSSDEIGYLAETFNDMVTALQKRHELEQLKEDFVATLTHDLKVPLMASVQTLEYLGKGSYGDLSDKQKFITEQLISNNKDLLNMVNTILDSYHYESGKQTLIKRKININTLITECLQELTHLAYEKKHEITFFPENNELDIVIDRHEIKRVILNLLSNAIIYTHEGGSIEVFSNFTNDNAVISVKDNGIGISRKSINNLFERYSKGSNSLRKVGTGLGLYLSKQIIEAHNGKIWVESVQDVGSKFSFSLPVNNAGLSDNG